MRSINVGTLVHRVLIQQRDAVALDDSGAPTESGWMPLAYAQMGRLSRRSDRGGETLRGDQIAALMTDRWTMRYDARMDPFLVDVQKTRRLVYEGRVQDIVDAEVIDRKAGIELRTIAASRIPS